MKIILITFFLLTNYSCDFSRKTKNLNSNKTTKQSNIATEETVKISEIQSEKKDSMPDDIYTVETKINGKRYKVCSGYYHGVYALNNKNDTVFKLNELGSGEFLDFNKDGFKDIYIGYMTNVPGIYDVALFDTLTNTFKIVENFSSYPASQKLKNTNLYFSYHRSGCADSNWDSDLFIIKDYKTYKIGNISGRGCENDEKNGIYIYKTISNKEKLIRSFSITVIEKYKKYKWGFIEDYWSKNYKLFIDEKKSENLTGETTEPTKP